jgi:hypothetical protein
MRIHINLSNKQIFLNFSLKNLELLRELKIESVHALIEKRKLQTKLVKTNFQDLFFLH